MLMGARAQNAVIFATMVYLAGLYSSSSFARLPCQTTDMVWPLKFIHGHTLLSPKGKKYIDAG